MRRFPGQYELLFVVTEDSKPIYLGLTDAKRSAVKAEIGLLIRDTIDLDQLENWDFSHNKIVADDQSHKAESEVRSELEELVKDLGANGNRLTIKPNAMELDPAVLEYDKNFDCGRSCHHKYNLYLSSAGGTFLPWIVSGASAPQVLFQMRVSLMWITPPELIYPKGLLIPIATTKEGLALRRKGTAKVSAPKKSKRSKARARAARS